MSEASTGEGGSRTAKRGWSLGHLSKDLIQGRLSLRSACRFAPQPIICIGRNKTGTTSVKAAFKAMGYRIAPQRPAEALLSQWRERDFRQLRWFCRFYDAFQDAPFSFPYTYVVLDQFFPKAKFILTVRDDADQWFSSVVRFAKKRIGKGRLPTVEDLQEDSYCYPGWSWEVHQALYGVRSPEELFDPVRYKEEYERHNRDVQDYFRDRPNKLLVLNVKEADAYFKLATFLGKNVTRGTAFPWENRT